MFTFRLTARWLAMLTLIALTAGGIGARSAPSSPLAAPIPAAPAASAANSSGENIDLVQNLGGGVDAFYHSGDRLYVLIGGDLITVDVANPAQPVVLGRAALPAPPQVAAFAGEYLYFYSSRILPPAEQRLYIIDLHDPLTPRVAATYAVERTQYEAVHMAQAIEVDAGYVYLLIHTTESYLTPMMTLNIIDVADPANPVGVTSTVLPLPSAFGDMALVDGRLYVGYWNGYTGALIIDVSDPTAPLAGKIWNVTTPQIDAFRTLSYIHVAADRLYMAYGDAGFAMEDKAFKVFDVANPAQPIQLGPLMQGEVDPLTSELIGVTGRNGLFVQSGEQFALRVVNLNNPAAPALVGSLNLGKAINPHGLVHGSLVYLLGEEPSGATVLHIVDIQNPAAPVELGRQTVSPFQSVVSALEDNQVVHLLTSPNRWFDEQQYPGSLRSYDFSNPARPVELARLELDFVPGKLLLEEGYLYVSKKWPFGGMVVIDVRNLQAPAIVSDFTDRERAGWANVLGVKNRRAYINPDGYHLEVVDFTNFAAPTWAATLDIRATSIVFSANIMWVLYYNSTYNAQWLAGLDMTNPTVPVQVADLAVVMDSLERTKMVIKGHDIYLWLPDNVLRVINVANPAAPVQVLNYALGLSPLLQQEYASQLAVDSDYVYAAVGSTLIVLDIARLNQPSIVASLQGIRMNVGFMAVNQGLIFLQKDNALTVLRNRAGSVAGVVRQANRQPFAGARLDLSTGLTATTDLAGGYRFQDLPRTTVSITPTLAGYAFWPPQRSASLPPNASADFVITARPATVALSPNGPARLVITDTQGLPTTFDFAASLAPSATVTPTPLLHQAPFGLTFAGHAFELAAGTAEVTVTVGLSAADLRLASAPGQLALWRRSGQAWAASGCGAASYDPVARRLTARLCQAGEYAALAPTHQLVMPQLRIR